MEKKQRTLGKRYEAPEAEGIELVPFEDFVQYGNTQYGQNDSPLNEDIEGIDTGTW